MALQIRIYSIQPGNMDVFVNAWREQLAPLRLQLGFTIPGAWVLRETDQFIWLMGYDGPEAWEVKDKQYFDSPDRRSLDPNPAQWILKMEEYFVDPVQPFDFQHSSPSSDSK